MKKSVKYNLNIAQKTVIGIIYFYQKTISPDHGLISPLFPNGVCRYTTSCSDYMIAKIKENGVLFGVLKGSFRILSCNPFLKNQNNYS